MGPVLELVGPHCDLEERLRMVPPSARGRGLYLRNIAAVLDRAGKGDELRRVIGPTRYSPVRYYPMAEHLIVLAAGGAVLRSPAEVHAGMKEIYRLNAQTFAESLLGRTLLRVLSPDPERLLRQAVAGRRLTSDYGRWELEFPEPRRARMEFHEEYVWIESALVGAALGTFEMVGLRPEIRAELSGPLHGFHDIRW